MRSWLGICLLVGCGPSVSATDDGSNGGSEGTLVDGTTTADPGATGIDDGETTSPATTTTTTDSTGSVDSSSSDDGLSFLLPTDLPTSCQLLECDVWSQDCPRGEKCAPWSACQPDGTWNATRCYPIDEAPAAPGEPCQIYEGGIYSGADDCEQAAVCWNVDPDTLTGTCVAMCEGDPSDPTCAGANACVIANDGAITLCLPECDPIAQDCDAGQGCYPVEQGTTPFACLPEGLQVETGQQVPPSCAAGSTDVDGTLLASCDDDAEVCCATFCNPAAPACEGELVCTPLEDEPSVGLCLDG